MTVLTEIGFKTRDEKEERGFFVCFVLKLMLAAAVGLFQLGLAEEGRGVPAADRTRSVCLRNRKENELKKSTVLRDNLFLQCMCFGCNPTFVSFDFSFVFNICFNRS